MENKLQFVANEVLGVNFEKCVDEALYDFEENKIAFIIDGDYYEILILSEDDDIFKDFLSIDYIILKGNNETMKMDEIEFAELLIGEDNRTCKTNFEYEFCNIELMNELTQKLRNNLIS